MNFDDVYTGLPFKSAYLRDDDDDDWNGVGSMRTIKHFWQRRLGVNEGLEEILCDLLRDGPYERFQSASKCVIEVGKW